MKLKPGIWEGSIDLVGVGLLDLCKSLEDRIKSILRKEEVLEGSQSPTW